MFLPFIINAKGSKADSIKQFDVVINEIMADPTPVVGLPAFEYIELYNRTAKSVSLNGWKLAIGTRVKAFANCEIEPNSFLIITDTSAVKYFKSYGNVYGFSSVIINNSGQTIILYDDKARVISSVSFTDDWYCSDYKKEGGWSLELIDPDNPCGGKENWIASKDKSGGTPGTMNSVYSSNPDNSLPELDRASVIDSMTIKLYFSEPLDSCSIKISDFIIDNNIGIPKEIDLISPFYNSVILKLSSAIQKKTIYTVSLTRSVKDCSGNESLAEQKTRFALPEAADKNEVIINEILTNPRDNGAQFVELYNRSQKVIDMKDLMLCTMDTVNNKLMSEKAICADGYLLFPGDYCALSVEPDLVKKQYYTNNPKWFIQMPSFPQFNIDDGIVVISDKAENIIDKLVYSPDMQYALLNDTKGVSLERISFEKPTQDKTNWHSASQTSGFATPAYKNSQYAETYISDNTISVSPDIFSPDNDGRDDILTISYNLNQAGNLGNLTIYDPRGRLVKTLVNNQLLGTTGSFYWDGLNDSRDKALIGIYIIYFEIHDMKGKIKHYKKTAVLGGKI